MAEMAEDVWIAAGVIFGGLGALFMMTRAKKIPFFSRSNIPFLFGLLLSLLLSLLLKFWMPWIDPFR